MTGVGRSRMEVPATLDFPLILEAIPPALSSTLRASTPRTPMEATFCTRPIPRILRPIAHGFLTTGHPPLSPTPFRWDRSRERIFPRAETRPTPWAGRRVSSPARVSRVVEEEARLLLEYPRDLR